MFITLTTGCMKNQGHRQAVWQILIRVCVVVLAAAVFLPGKSGPFIFDDYSNLLDNSYVKVTELNASSLHQAAYSLEAGPLKRPISMTSFALNYYYSGSFQSSTPYKLTNIALHALNAIFLYWLIQLVFLRLVEIDRFGLSINAAPWLAAGVSVLWAIHPIQVSTVLYVVQRMTELSTLFTILGLIFYLKGRAGIIKGLSWAPWVAIIGPLFCGLLGILSKETALLLPVFIACLEFTLYADEQPWREWASLSRRTKILAYVVLGLLAIVAVVGVILYALPSYNFRRFTLEERILTEGRVLLFYLSLILIPRIDQFGHQHDDIVLSTSLFTPWTTLPSIVGHIALIAFAISMRRRQTLIALGIFWFYVSHLLESTVFALEISYEHRNYLALVGPLLVIVGLTELLRSKLKWQKAYLLLVVIGIVFVPTTILRASQWANPNSFYRYEAIHHPNSARIQIGLSILLEAQGQYAEAMNTVRRAVEIEPQEAGYWLQLHLLAARQKIELPKEDHDKTIALLRSEPLSSTVVLSLQHMSGCIQTWCQSLQRPLEVWARTIIDRGANAPKDISFYYYLAGLSAAAQGRAGDAIAYFHISYDKDASFLHPLFALANLYLQLRQLPEAEQVLEELTRANKTSSYPRYKDLANLEADVDTIRRQTKRTRTANP